MIENKQFYRVCDIWICVKDFDNIEIITTLKLLPQVKYCCCCFFCLSCFWFQTFPVGCKLNFIRNNSQFNFANAFTMENLIHKKIFVPQKNIICFEFQTIRKRVHWKPSLNLSFSKRNVDINNSLRSCLKNNWIHFKTFQLFSIPNIMNFCVH